MSGSEAFSPRRLQIGSPKYPFWVNRPHLSDLVTLYNPRTLIALDTSTWLDLLMTEDSAATETLDLLESMVGRIVTPPTISEELARQGAQKVEEAINAGARGLNPVANIPDETSGPGKARYRDTVRALRDLADQLRSSLRQDVESRYARIAVLTSRTTTLPLKNEAEDELARTREDRFAHRIPPGFKDLAKERGDVAYNDLYLWFELIQIAGERASDIAFFTNERKDDWWQKNGPNVLVTALPALRDEMRARSGQSFVLLYGGLIVEQFEAASSVAAPSAELFGFSVADVLRQNTIESNVARQLYEMNARFDQTYILPERLAMSQLIDGFFGNHLTGLSKTLNQYSSTFASTYFGPLPSSLKVIADFSARMGLTSQSDGIWVGSMGHLPSMARDFQLPLGYSNVFADAVNISSTISDTVRNALGLHGTGVPSLPGISSSMLRGLGLMDRANFAWALPPNIAALHQAFDSRHYLKGISGLSDQFEAFRRAALTMPKLDPDLELLVRLSGHNGVQRNAREAAVFRRHRSVLRRRARRRLRGCGLNLLRKDHCKEALW